MRSDFQKLLCECYKTGRGSAMTSKQIRSKLKNSRSRGEDGDYYSTKVKRKRIIGWEHKDFGENLAPLERFINKQVGKKWDDVYSEICKHNSKAGAVGLHIFQHLYGFIEVKVEKRDDGAVYSLPSAGFRRWFSSELTFGTLYVDPDDNIIKKYRRNKPKKRQPKPVTEYSVVGSSCESIKLDDGIWYLVTLGDVPKPEMRSMPRFDPKTGEYKIVYEKYYPRVKCAMRGSVCYLDARKYVVSKKQLNKKQLRDFGVSNAA